MKGSMLKRATRKPAKDRRDKRSSPSKVLFQDPVGHVLPPSLSQFRWNVDKVERKLQEKIQEKTKIAGNFVYQQAYRLLECTRGEGIDFASFREQLRIKFGIILEDGELQLLFDKYDEDHNGTIDLNEFIRRVLPPDYHYGRQWFELSQQESEEKQAALKRESRNEFLMGMGVVRDDIDNTGETSNWTLETLLKQIQTKVVQKTPSGDDQYRRAFKMLRCGRDQGIRMRELRNNLKTKFGIFVSEKQMKELFARFDQDGSGEIDLQEFLQFVEPPAYTGTSKVPRGLWTEDPDDGENDETDPGAVEEQEQEDGLDDGDVTAHHCCQYQHEPHCHRRQCDEDSEIVDAPSQNAALGPSTSTKNVIKKERPMSANPKKQALLKQRREQQTASATQLLERHLPPTTPTPNLNPNGRHSVTKATQTRRMTMSMADIHLHADARPSTAAPYRDGLRYDQDDDDRGSVRSSESGGSGVRPRSAGSVAGSTASTAASVRGASYMRRPSTPQHLRQKCLESRLAGVTTDAKPLYNANTTTTTVAKRVSLGAVNTNPKRSQGVAKATKSLAKSRVADDESDDYEAPRVVRVHPKQQDVRPYSQGGRVLLRSKVSSAGCR